jgi:hypothetical protein
MMGREMSGLNAAFGTDRVSFTAMSGDAILAIMGRIAVHAQYEDGYDLKLNATDAKCLVEALASYCEMASQYEDSESNALLEWAESFLSGIGETLNVEMI